MKRDGLLVIAIDAADPALVRGWAADGSLPTLGKLMSQGFVARVDTPPAVLEGAVWPTLVTGSWAGHHGMASHQQIKPGTYELHLGCRSSRMPTPPFWAYLGRAGKRVAVIDAPLTPVVKGLNGIQVVNWGAHDAFWSARRASWPSRLADELIMRFGAHPVKVCDAEHQRTLAEYEELRDRLIAGARTKTELLRHCLGLEPWDFFFGVFSESHCVGHQCWHLMDRGHPRHDPAASPTLRSAIRDVYTAIDQGVGRLLESVPTGTHVLIVLSHGMGPYYAGSHLLDEVLERLGAGPATDRPPTASRHAVGDRYRRRRQLWTAAQLLPTELREGVKARLPPRLLTAAWHWGHPPEPVSGWARMRAFSVPSNGMTGAIRINLKGREPAGLVAPGGEYEALCRQLTEGLLELTNADTGRRAVQWVARCEELYTGPRRDDLPDLFVEWEHDAPITTLRSARIGTVSGVLDATRTGDHRPGGLLIGLGPRFASGELPSVVRTLDIAPTVLDFLGTRPPARFQGRSALPSLRRGAVAA